MDILEDSENSCSNCGESNPDNSNYYDAAAAYNCNDREVSNVFTSVHMSKILDVTNVSNVKCKFYYKLQQAFAVRGITSSNETYVNFIRLGDT